MSNRAGVISFALVASAMAARVGAAEMNVHVRDDLGNPVSGAQVAVWGSTGAVVGVSDASGDFHAALDESQEMVLWMQSAAGASNHYEARGEMVWVDGTNPIGTIEQDFVLKRMLNPQPMVMGWLPNVPVLGEPCGFDFYAGDWTAPHGVGNEAHMVVTVTGTVDAATWEHEGRVQVEFPGDGSGCIPYAGFGMEDWSRAVTALRSDVQAPEAGYVTETNWVVGIVRDAEGKRVGTRDDPPNGNNWYLRVRHKGTNDVGAIYYGKMEDVRLHVALSGMWRLCGTYFLGAVPEDRGLEHLMGTAFGSNVFLRVPWPGPGEAYSPEVERLYRYVGPGDSGAGAAGSP